MKQEEAYQIQKNNYFLYHGRVVKVVGNSPYNEDIFIVEDIYIVENKYSRKYYADVEELEPIILTEDVFNQIGAQKIAGNECVAIYSSDTFIFQVSEHKIDYISVEDNSIFVFKGTKHLHFIQNTLRLLGEEIELKQ